VEQWPGRPAKSTRPLAKRINVITNYGDDVLTWSQRVHAPVFPNYRLSERRTVFSSEQAFDMVVAYN
jgi:hypothetical protein